MKAYHNRIINKTVRIVIFCCLGIMASLLQLSCRKANEQNNHVLSVDMSIEHDSGRFKPELGDKVFVTGNFTEWNKDGVLLSDIKGNWIYSANINDYLKRRTENLSPIDTLEFNFFLRTGDSRELSNHGWEAVARRKITRTKLESKSPVFIYNVIYDGAEPIEVTFRVGMNNQKTLGFFQPEKGDEVVVSGSFCAWSLEGVALKDEDGSGVYSQKITVKQNPEKPIEYRFRMRTKRKAILPNQGWETQSIRQAVLSLSSAELPYVEFNNVRRVARFIIDTKRWETERKFKPLQGDILQIKLILDGKENLTDALFQVNEHEYETALMIPLNIREVQWQVIKNMKEELTISQKAEVGLNGTIINN